MYSSPKQLDRRGHILVFSDFFRFWRGVFCLQEKIQGCTIADSEGGEAYQLPLSPHVFNLPGYVIPQPQLYMNKHIAHHVFPTQKPGIPQQGIFANIISF